MASNQQGTGFSLFRNKQKKEEENAASAGMSEETKRKAEAAKNYIDNMYKNRYQDIQERTNRQGCAPHGAQQQGVA